MHSVLSTEGSLGPSCAAASGRGPSGLILSANFCTPRSVGLLLEQSCECLLVCAQTLGLTEVCLGVWRLDAAIRVSHTP